MIYLIDITFLNGYKSEFLLISSLVSVLFGIFIIVTRNPVVSVLFLIGLFFTISLHLMMLGLYFIGLSYLLVYVGAVSILFIFILMLINVRVSELLTEGRNSIPLAVIAILTFNLTINNIEPYSMYVLDALYNGIYYIYLVIINVSNKAASVFTYSLDKSLVEKDVDISVGNVVSNFWDICLVENNHITSIGNILYTNLFILLILTSLVLLLSMVGTIVITVKRKS